MRRALSSFTNKYEVGSDDFVRKKFQVALKSLLKNATAGNNNDVN